MKTYARKSDEMSILLFSCVYLCAFEWFVFLFTSGSTNLIYTMSTFCQPMRFSFIYLLLYHSNADVSSGFYDITFRTFASHVPVFDDCVYVYFLHFRWLSQTKLNKVSIIWRKKKRVITFHDLIRTSAKSNNLVWVEASTWEMSTTNNTRWGWKQGNR